MMNYYIFFVVLPVPLFFLFFFLYLKEKAKLDSLKNFPNKEVISLLESINDNVANLEKRIVEIEKAQDLFNIRFSKTEKLVQDIYNNRSKG